jgi:hypothetical protein
LAYLLGYAYHPRSLEPFGCEALIDRDERRPLGRWQTVQNRKWRATADEDGHYCFAVAL